jgi:ADP-heptose:LPS heptosyltransferase
LLRILERLPAHYRFVLLGDNGERRAANVIKESLGERALTLCGKTGLREAIAVLQHCRAAIAMDSALAHFAAAVETPVVIFSMQPQQGGNDTLDQSPVRFGPWCPPDRQLLIQPKHAWPGCENGCRWRSSRPHCIADVDIEAASEAIGAFLSRHVR